MAHILLDKLKESMQAVLPIGGIILVLHFTVVSMPMGTLGLMLCGMAILIVGLTLFSLGTDMAMMPMGGHIGSALLRSKSLAFLVAGGFIFGFIVTIAEPDLHVMTRQVPSVPDVVLLCSVAAGVALFLVFSMLRVLFRVKLAHLLIVMYSVTFVAALFSADYIAVALDASAVTTGPITVPFLLALSAGIASVSSTGSHEDNFGICGVCSVGPILAVLAAGLFYSAGTGGHASEAQATVSTFGEMLILFADGLLHSFGEVSMVVVPIVGIFSIFQFTHLKLSKTELVKIGVGLLYLTAGLTIFLSGVYRGFLPAGKFLGEAMGALENNWILVPICLFMGGCVVVAEPAVHVLTKQVEEITSGAISRSVLLFCMAAGVGIALSMAMARILSGVSIWWIILPGYTIALALTFFVPPIFVGIGFDSGGVAAGVVSAAFVLPFTLGVCESAGGNAMTDAFGVVGMIAMMPPITLQIVGVLYNRRMKKIMKKAAEEAERLVEETDPFSFEDKKQDADGGLTLY